MNFYPTFLFCPYPFMTFTKIISSSLINSTLLISFLLLISINSCRPSYHLLQSIQSHCASHLPATHLHCCLHRRLRDLRWRDHRLLWRITREKVNGATVNVRINPSKVFINKLRLNKDRKYLLDRKAKGRAAADKKKGTKFAPEDIM
ncbi:hypothetical protein QYF36_011894 [Acer negundo]|nr:hypothetical protein QYF36_011894 [Acer negundo]